MISEEYIPALTRRQRQLELFNKLKEFDIECEIISEDNSEIFVKKYDRFCIIGEFSYSFNKIVNKQITGTVMENWINFMKKISDIRETRKVYIGNCEYLQPEFNDDYTDNYNIYFKAELYMDRLPGVRVGPKSKRKIYFIHEEE